MLNYAALPYIKYIDLYIFEKSNNNSVVFKCESTQYADHFYWRTQYRHAISLLHYICTCLSRRHWQHMYCNVMMNVVNECVFVSRISVWIECVWQWEWWRVCMTMVDCISVWVPLCVCVCLSEWFSDIWQCVGVGVCLCVWMWLCGWGFVCQWEWINFF